MNSYKIKSISGFNFVGYSSVMVNLDENVNYLIGPNGQGKTTLGLNLLWFILQGIAEKSSDGKIPLLGERFRFIGNGGATALGELVLYDESTRKEIRVIRKLTKTGTELSFSGPVGMELDQQWLNNLFNIFLIAPHRFINLSAKEQSIALCIDTEKWNLPIRDLKEKFTEINRVLQTLKKIEEVEPVEYIPMDTLQQRKAEIKERMAEQYTANQKINKDTRTAWETAKRLIDSEVTEFNNLQTRLATILKDCEVAAGILVEHGFSESNEELVEFFKDIRSKIKPLRVASDLYPPEPTNLQDMPADYIPTDTEVVYIRELPDDIEMTGIDTKILAATETNAKALLYKEYKEKVKLRGEKELELQYNKDERDKLEAERLEYIKQFKFPFESLSVDDEGGLLLNDKPLKDPYFSTGELIRIIPTLIASQNPELKYVFIQEANLLDEKNLALIEKELTQAGFQLVFELVGQKRIIDKNCILLRDSSVVHGEQMRPVKTMNLEEATKEES